jgi:hypothetical protein
MPSWNSLGSMKGPTGSPGVGFNWRGAYNAGTAYVVNDVVSFTDGSNYICILATTGHAPGNATYWSLYTSVGATGTPGSTGAPGQGFTWRGAYNGATAYAPYDVISYNGSSYHCILASTGNLPTNTTYWNLVAQIGPTGATGTRGSIFQPSVANVGALPSIDGTTVMVGDMCWDAAGNLYQAIA